MGEERKLAGSANSEASGIFGRNIDATPTPPGRRCLEVAADIDGSTERTFGLHYMVRLPLYTYDVLLSGKILSLMLKDSEGQLSTQTYDTSQSPATPGQLMILESLDSFQGNLGPQAAYGGDIIMFSTGQTFHIFDRAANTLLGTLDATRCKQWYHSDLPDSA